MRISDALKEVKDLNVDFGVGGVLKIVYRPPSWTPAELDELKANKDMTKIVEQIRRLVIQWDLTDDFQNLISLELPKPVLNDGGQPVLNDQGEPVLARDPLMHVPISIYLKIITSINMDGRPDPQA